MELTQAHKKHLKRFYDTLICEGIDVKNLDVNLIGDIDDGQSAILSDFRRNVSDVLHMDFGLIQHFYGECENSLDREFYLTEKGILKIQELFCN